ncbi:23221_t:CDS:1 [Cetraspora pellucida]|uniref:23221_t:CDS:1 n=1 Tax=Cetraspora pellucida TaxID=1433469 RepID=A0A9N9ETF9_9GLOM|nr:23221_t:CDS:1 [Cetraspora pellucida]
MINSEVCKLSNNAHRINDSSLNKLINALNNMHHLSNSIKVNKFLIISKKNHVYKVSSNDQIIKKFAYIFRRDKNVETIGNKDIKVIDNKKNDSIEIAIISSSFALSNLKSV